jgi:hypothetical protein
MGRKSPKIVIADKRKWAQDGFLGDADPKDYPQAAKKIKAHSFQVLSIHNAIDYEIGEHLSPKQVESLIHTGWTVDVKPFKEK